MNALQQQELEDIEVKESYKVTDIEGVNWCFRKLQILNKKIDEIESLASSEITRISKWRDKELTTISESEQYFRGLISEYLLEQKKLDPKYRITTPYGKANTRKQQPKFTYDDEKVIESLKNLGHMEFIKTVWEVKKAELKKGINIVGNMATTEDGEVIEGITIEEQDEKVSISLEG